MFTSSTKHDITRCLRDTGVTFGTSFVPEWNSSCIHTLTAYSAFSLTWPASMQIYDNKRNCLHEKRVQLPQDCFGTPTWPPFIVLENQYGRRDVSLRSRRLEVTGTGKNRARESSRAAFNLAPFTSKRQPTVTSCENVLLSKGVLSRARSDTHAPQAPDYSVCIFRLAPGGWPLSY